MALTFEKVCQLPKASHALALNHENYESYQRFFLYENYESSLRPVLLSLRPVLLLGRVKIAAINIRICVSICVCERE